MLHPDFASIDLGAYGTSAFIPFQQNIRPSQFINTRHIELAMTKPTAIQISKKRRLLLVTWADGHKSEYPWDGLRAACPCVTCRGGHENMGAPPDPTVFDLKPVQTYELTGADLVGNYALQLLWADGHRYGLYTWDYLRGLCPCEEDKQRAKPIE